MTVDVLIRVELSPVYPSVDRNEMLKDIQTYFRLKEHDDSLQCNGTKIAINSSIYSVVNHE